MQNGITQKIKGEKKKEKYEGGKKTMIVRQKENHTEFKHTMTNSASVRYIINMNLK